MTEGCYELCVTYGTYLSGSTGCFCACGVTLSCFKNLATNGTYLSGSTGCFCAGNVALSGFKNLTTYGTGLSVQAVSCFAGNVALSSFKNLTTFGTGLIVQAVSCFAGNVTLSGFKNLTTFGTGLIVYTISCFTGGMALSCFENLTTYGTGLSVFTVSVCACGVTLSCFKNLTTNGTYLSVYTISFCTCGVAYLTRLMTVVTISVTCIVVCVAASNGNCLEDLFSNVDVACCTGSSNNGRGSIRHQERHCIRGCRTVAYENVVYRFSIGDIYVSGVVEEESVSECVSRGSVNNVIECINFNGEVTEGQRIECVVVAKENEFCLGVECLNGKNRLGVELVEAYVTEYVGFSGEYERISNGNNNRVGLVSCESLTECLFVDLLESRNSVNVLVEEIKDVNVVRVVLGNACCNESCLKLCTSRVNVSYVLFTNESYPIHCGGSLAVKKLVRENLVDRRICEAKERLSKSFSFGRIEEGFVFNLERAKELFNSRACVSNYGISEIAVEVFSNVAEELSYSKAGDHAFLVAEGNEVSLSDFSEINVIPAHCGELIIGETKVTCENFCVVSVFTTDGNVVGFFCNKVLTGECVVQEYVNCLVDFNDSSEDVRLELDCELLESGKHVCFDCCSCSVSSLEAETLEEVEACVKTFGEKDLCSGLEGIQESRGVDEVEECKTKLVYRILKDREKLVGLDAALNELNDLVHESNGLFDLCDQLINNSLQLKNLRVNLCKLCFDSFDCCFNLCDFSLELSLEECVVCSNCFFQLRLKGFKLGLESVQLYGKLTLNVVFEGVELIESLILRIIQSFNDLFKNAGFKKLVPSLFSEFFAEVNHQLEYVAESCENAFGRENVGVNTKSVKVNLNHSPCSVAVGIEPANDSGKDNVCVVNNVAEDVFAVVHADEGENCEDGLVVVYDEVEHFIGVFCKESDNNVGVFVEPVVEPSVYLGKCREECLYKVVVRYGEIFLNVLYCNAGHFENRVSSIVNSVNNSAIDYSDLGIEVCAGVNRCDLKESVERFNVAEELFTESNNESVGLCVESVSVVDQIAECFNRSLSLCKCYCNLKRELFASDVFCVCLNPSLCVSDSCESGVEVSVCFCDVAFLNGKLVRESVSFVVVFNKNVDEVLEGFLLCGVVALVCSDNCVSKSLVALCGGMRTETVTNDATAEETEQTCKLAFSKDIAEKLGSCKRSSRDRCRLIQRLCRCNNSLNNKSKGLYSRHNLCVTRSILVGMNTHNGRYIGSLFFCYQNAQNCITDSVTGNNVRNAVFGKTHYLFYKRVVLGIRVGIEQQLYNLVNGDSIRQSRQLLSSLKQKKRSYSLNINHRKDVALLKSLLVRTHDAVKHRCCITHHRSKAENHLQRRSLVSAKNYCIFKSEVKCNSSRLCFMLCSPCKLFYVGLSKIVKDISHGRIAANNAGLGKDTPNHALFVVIAYNGLYESIADGGIKITNSAFNSEVCHIFTCISLTIAVIVYVVKITAVSVNHTFYEISFSVVELCVLVHAVADELHVGGKSCDECVHRGNESFHQRADRNAFYITLFSKGIHEGNHHDLCIGIQLENCFNRACVVQYERETDVNRNLCKLHQHLVGFNLGTNNALGGFEKGSLQLKNLCLHFGLKLMNCVFNSVDTRANNSGAVEANNVKDSTKAEYTEVTVTNSD